MDLFLTSRRSGADCTATLGRDHPDGHSAHIDTHDGSSSTSSLRNPDAPHPVCTAALHSGDTIDDPALVKEYRRSYDLLRAAALPPEASLALIEETAEDDRNGKQRG
ncbi:Scr1 family TA system antitoxin-like transcriptional regulator [Streptomyces sp. 6-11-2]|uniref:Scr1 family TA system antitoxin-like transcriptional regulator n=1 Tax=Streptomyces sp. 6-11-2 TaxID=2585753 RepID=UPI001173941B|nr:hypothetical protein TNCT6_09510 [Streptomyces sp. 6-11-2]